MIFRYPAQSVPPLNRYALLSPRFAMYATPFIYVSGHDCRRHAAIVFVFKFPAWNRSSRSRCLSPMQKTRIFHPAPCTSPSPLLVDIVCDLAHGRPAGHLSGVVAAYSVSYYIHIVTRYDKTRVFVLFTNYAFVAFESYLYHRVYCPFLLPRFSEALQDDLCSSVHNADEKSVRAVYIRQQQRSLRFLRMTDSS